MLMLLIQFVFLAGLIVVSGYYLTHVGDKLADETGFGENLVGFVLLAAVTSMPELSTSISAAAIGEADLVFGNMVGSNIFNILVIALILIFLRKARHSIVSASNTFAGALGILIAGIAGLCVFTGFQFAGITLLIIYIFMMILSYRYEKRENEHLEGPAPSFKFKELFRYYLTFLGLSVVIVVSGYFMTTVCDQIAVTPVQLGDHPIILGRTFVGQLFMAIATSLPELIVSFSAVRLGKIDMAYSNIYGSNIFNMAILGLSALFYNGNMFSDVSNFIFFSFLMFVVLCSISIAALKYRFKSGFRLDALLILLLCLFNFYYIFSK